MTVKTENEDEADEADAEREDEEGEGEEKPMTWPLETINTVQTTVQTTHFARRQQEKGTPKHHVRPLPLDSQLHHCAAGGPGQQCPLPALAPGVGLKSASASKHDMYVYLQQKRTHHDVKPSPNPVRGRAKLRGI
jgi:hypothetical protein